ncbi:MAG: orotidine-5'-phosphate decarboxylase [Alphaproteobacteria bacterium]|nr:orotidine-5'-phosphate decarboxylase [Alphaproteobacteria bacterium]
MTINWADFVGEKTKDRGELVLGIDPVLSDIPDCFKKSGASTPDAVRDYVMFLLEMTADQVGFVKYQSAFFEALGAAGVAVLAESIAAAKRLGHGIILDAKRGDVGGTAAAYARAYLTPASACGLSDLEVDCMTINPFLGPETLEPFVDCAKKYGKGLFVLVKTSNPGAGWLQDKEIDGARVSDRIAQLVAGWAEETVGISGLSSIGAVIGATYPEDGRRLRGLMPNSIFLAPGLGPQGGKADGIASLRRTDGSGVLVPVQRGITKVDDLSITKDAYATLVQQRVQEYKTKLSQGGML